MTKTKKPKSNPLSVAALLAEPIVPTAQPAQQTMSVEQALSLASQHQQTGRLQEAEMLIKQVLQAKPGHPHALHMLGIVAHSAGKTEIAIGLLEKAVAADGSIAMYQANLTEMYRITGKLDKAINIGKKAASLDPNLASAHANLGIAYFDKEDFDKAEKCHKKALELNPSFAPSLNNMGSILGKKEDKEGAIEFYRRAINANPNNAESYNNLGVMLTQTDQPEEASEVLQKALSLQPNYAEAHCNLGFALAKMEKDNDALNCFQRALQLRAEYLEPYQGIARIYKDRNQLDQAEEAAQKALKFDQDNAESHSIMGSIYLGQGYLDKSEKAFEKAQELDKDSLGALTGLGNIYLERGKFKDAENYFRKATEKDSKGLGALFSIVQTKKAKPDDPEIELLEEQLKNIDSIPKKEAIYLHFALGKVYDDIGEYDKAFPHFMKACDMNRQRVEYDAEHKEQSFVRTREIFTKEFVKEHKGNGYKSDVPIFVLGMPRSGTTLTEQIIASHPNVYGAGELVDLLDLANWKEDRLGQKPFPENLAELTPDSMKEMGQEYVKLLEEHAPKSPKISDKMPANFFHIGLIHLILPQAKIVHLNRHPLDVCLSCYTRFFSFGQNQTYDMVELGRFYREYKKLMDHWREVLPKTAFLDLHYEELIADTEKEAKRIIKHCGLEWDESCLEFYKHKRSVRTASVTQVRQPIYKTSVARWKRYEKFLGPLVDTLGDVLDDYS